MRVFHWLMTHPLFSFILFFMPTAIISYFGWYDSSRCEKQDDGKQVPWNLWRSEKCIGYCPFKSRKNVMKQSKTLGILWQSRFLQPHFRFICLIFRQNDADKFIFGHITEKIIVIFSSFWYNFQKLSLSLQP